MSRSDAPHTISSSVRRPVSPLLGAIAFLAFYLAVDFAASAVSTGTMPLPGAPADEVYEYFSANTGASILTGVLQTLSVLGLAVVVAGPVTRAGRASGGRRRGALIAGTTAVAAMLVSSGLAITSGVVADSASVDTVVALRNAGFYSGGVVHVVALGLFVLAVTRIRGWTRPVRVMGRIAGVPSVLSIASLLWFYASPLLPAGRVLSMVCLVVAGVSLVRGRTPAPDRAEA